MRNSSGILILLCLVLTLLGCAVGKRQSTASRKMDIYLLMGQSNMAGRGRISRGDTSIKNKKVFMLTRDLKWTYAKDPLHFDKPGIAGVGPGLSFGLEMQKAKGGTAIGLVPTAVGGTSINSWTPGGYDKATRTHPYDDAEKRIVAAMANGVIKGVIWHQGEADSQADSAALYLPKLIRLIQRVRNLTGNPDLPFVVGELGKFKAKSANINVQLVKLPGLVPHTAVVSSDGLVHKGDSVHFDAGSAVILGRRYAEKMMYLQRSK